MGKYGYDFYFKIGDEVLTLPVTPSSFTMKIGSNNKVVTLINEGDINILKSPSLVEFEFDARFPMRKYPYSRKPLNFETYLNKFTDLKTEKTPFILNVIRTTPDGKGTWATVRRVTLEDLEVKESADEGDDVIVSFNLKEYKEYGVVVHKTSTEPSTTSTSAKPRATDSNTTKSKTYTVKSGDTLWGIAKAEYGNGAKWKTIYEANKSIIESTAEARRGKGKGSSNGHWIYPGTKLTIPGSADSSSSGQAQGANTTTDSKTTKAKYAKGTLGITMYNINNVKPGSITVSYYYDNQLVTTTIRNTDDTSELLGNTDSTGFSSGTKTFAVDNNKKVTVTIKTQNGQIGEKYTSGWYKSYNSESKTYTYSVKRISTFQELILSWL